MCYSTRRHTPEKSFRGRCNSKCPAVQNQSLLATQTVANKSPSTSGAPECYQTVKPATDLWSNFHPHIPPGLTGPVQVYPERLHFTDYVMCVLVAPSVACSLVLGSLSGVSPKWHVDFFNNEGRGVTATGPTNTVSVHRVTVSKTEIGVP